MTDIPAAGTVSAGQSIASRVGASRTRLAENYETFLGLLTTQLRNQDPLSPMDANQFTQQIVQMTGVEQQLLTNDLLTALVNQGSGGMSDAAAYIGRTVTADSPAARLSDGEATWTYDLDGAAASAVGTITNEAGVVVWRGPLSDLSDGEHAFEWNGRNTAGNALPDGTYNLSISATARDGDVVPARTVLRGVVTGVEQRDGQVFLITAAGDVPLSSVRGVVQTVAAPAAGNPAQSALSSVLSALGA